MLQSGLLGTHLYHWKLRETGNYSHTVHNWNPGALLASVTTDLLHLTNVLSQPAALF